MSESIDYDIHGLAGIRLINPSPGDAAAVAGQLGPFQAPLSREPDIVLHFVEHLVTPRLRYVGAGKQGFTDDGYFILRSRNAKGNVRVAFDQIGRQCEMVCESGLRAVPLLEPILQMSVLKKDFVPLHASAFVYKDSGVLLTGWANCGKTSALLAFAAHGAEYVGDEWVLISGDGQKMFGIPGNIQLRDRHLEYLPQVRLRIKPGALRLSKWVHWLDRVQQRVSKGRLGETFPVKLLRRALPAMRRQVQITAAPQVIFGSRVALAGARPEKVFLFVSHEEPGVCVVPADPLEIARRMVSSIRCEQMPFMEHYLAFKFAFPARRNDLIERAHELQFEILCRALAGKEAYEVSLPYPAGFDELFEGLSPFCEARMESVTLSA